MKIKPAFNQTALPAQIRGLRQRLGLSQGEFASLVGVRQQKVSEWEQGKRLRQLLIAMRLVALLDTKLGGR